MTRPLLKWAGGKRQLLPFLRRCYPAQFNRYLEPFFGSGAVFFDLHGARRLEDRDALLIDSNADLIGCYRMVRDSPDRVARELQRLAKAHARRGAEHYYLVRDTKFNPLRSSRREIDGNILYTPELAAMFIYLNRTGFNGLFRLNARGDFNVPAGRYARPTIPDGEALRRVADALRSPRVTLIRGGFEAAGDLARAGDFVYFDPPYAPLSVTASFTSYTAPRFTDDDHARLQQTVLDLARRGCSVVVSNSTAPTITALYETNAAAERAGLRAIRVPARRAINSNPSRRGVIEEYVITNGPVADVLAGVSG